MKILPFSVPKVQHTTFQINRELIDDFYPYYHRHEELQIVYLNNVDGNLLLGNKLFEFQDNSLFVVGANQPHIFRRRSERQNSVETLNVFFNPAGNLKPLFNLAEWTAVKDFYANLGLAQVPTSKMDMAISLMDTLDKAEGAKQFLAFLTFIEWISHEAKTLDVKNGSLATVNYESRINQVIQFIWENFDQEIYLQDGANVANMSREAFSRFFKKSTNINFVQYLNEVRIHHASEKLMEGDLPIHQIAMDSGYNQVTHFNRIFKKLKNMTPLAYRKKILNQHLMEQ